MDASPHIPRCIRQHETQADDQARRLERLLKRALTEHEENRCEKQEYGNKISSHILGDQRLLRFKWNADALREELRQIIWIVSV